MTIETLLKYTEQNYSKENEVIASSMINFYSLKNKLNKSKNDEVLQKTLYEQVLVLFEQMSLKIELELGVDHNHIFSLLKEIHIKT